MGLSIGLGIGLVLSLVPSEVPEPPAFVPIFRLLASTGLTQASGASWSSPGQTAFTDSSWMQPFTSSVLTDNAALAPNGSLTASSYRPDAGSAVPGLLNQFTGTLVSIPTTWSLYAKSASTGQYMFVLADLNTNSTALALVDLSDGSVVTANDRSTVLIASAGGGWYRVNNTYLAGTTETLFGFAWNSNPDGEFPYEASGDVEAYVWHASVTQGPSILSWRDSYGGVAVGPVDADMRSFVSSSYTQPVVVTGPVQPVRVPAGAALRGSLNTVYTDTVFSFAIALRYDGLGGTQCYLNLLADGATDDDTGSQGLKLGIENGGIVLRRGGSVLMRSAIPSVGRHLRFIVVIDGSEYRCYQNGIMISNGATSGAFAISDVLLGAQFTEGVPVANTAISTFFEVLFYGVALTPSDVSEVEAQLVGTTGLSFISTVNGATITTEDAEFVTVLGYHLP